MYPNSHSHCDFLRAVAVAYEKTAFRALLPVLTTHILQPSFPHCSLKFGRISINVLFGLRIQQSVIPGTLTSCESALLLPTSTKVESSANPWSKQKYPEGSVTAWPFSKIVVAGSPAPVTSPPEALSRLTVSDMDPSCGAGLQLLAVPKAVGPLFLQWAHCSWQLSVAIGRVYQRLSWLTAVLPSDPTLHLPALEKLARRKLPSKFEIDFAMSWNQSAWCLQE